MSKAIGIDLGTTNTVVSAILDNQPVIIKTAEGASLIPSVVCYDTKMCNDFLVGQQAKDMAATQPDNVVYSVKRLMGMRYYDEEDARPSAERDLFLKAVKKIGYRLAPDPQGKDDGVRIVLGDNRCLTPVEISTMILKKAREEAEHFLGEPVSSAVITVPAWFYPHQIEATKRAGELAGLEVLEILDEPSAAAIAAARKILERGRYILVYDLGGGTFDVSLVQASSDRLRGRSLGGDNWLGGDNFDDELIKLVAEHIQKKEQYNPIDDRAFRSVIRRVVEEAKINLSKQDQTIINAPSCCAVPIGEGTRKRLVSVAGLVVTRAEFENRIRTYLDRTLQIVRETLRSGDYSNEIIDEVVLVGGPTYIPCVRKAMTDQFPGKVRSVEDVHPMHCVAQGAAIFAQEILAQRARMSVAEQVNKTKVSVERRVPFTIGIATQDGTHVDAFTPIIPRGARLPMNEPLVADLLAVEPTEMLVPVYAGENEQASRNIHQGNIVISFHESPIPPGTPVTVGLRLTEDRIIEVTIQVRGRDKIIDSLTYDEQPVDTQWQNELERTTSTVLRFLTEYEAYIPAVMATEMQGYLTRSEKALETNNRTEGRVIERKLTRLLLYGDQLANLLFKAEHLQVRNELSQPIREHLGAWCQAAKEVYSADKEKSTESTRADLAKAKQMLEVGISAAIRQLPHQKVSLLRSPIEAEIRNAAKPESPN